jgi:hypothetical protein
VYLFRDPPLNRFAIHRLTANSVERPSGQVPVGLVGALVTQCPRG